LNWNLIWTSRVEDWIEETCFTATGRWTGRWTERNAASSLRPVSVTTSASGHPEDNLKDL
jgi:hypothetical protein